jgi:single-strand DNA-binding protein
MYNKIILLGNLVKPIEIKNINGANIVNNTIAVNRKFKNKSGQLQEETLFVDVVFFSRTAEIVNQYLTKGSKVMIDGRLKFDQWEKDGIKHYKHSVVVENMQMVGSPANISNSNQIPQIQATQQNNNVPTVGDEEVPF